jgi:hypothetical protein
MTEETIITPTTTDEELSEEEDGTKNLEPIMKVYVPKEENINYHGERVFQF